MFLKMNTRHQAHKPVKECNHTVADFRKLRQRAKVVAIGPTVAEIWQYFDFSRWQSPLSWISKFLKNFNRRAAQRVELRHCAKFRRHRSNRGRDMAIFRFFQDGGRPPSWICYV